MATNTKKTTRTVDVEQDVDETTLSQTIAAEAAPPARPQGAPSLKPFSLLTRRQRAQFQEAWSRSLPESMLARLAEGGSTNLSIEQIGMRAAFNITADQQDALTLVAIDAEKFVEWAEAQDDDTISALFAWYQATQASGE